MWLMFGFSSLRYLFCPSAEHLEPKACCERSSCTVGTKLGCSEHSALVRGRRAGERRPRYASVGMKTMKTGEIKDEDADKCGMEQRGISPWTVFPYH